MRETKRGSELGRKRDCPLRWGAKRDSGIIKKNRDCQLRRIERGSGMRRRKRDCRLMGTKRGSGMRKRKRDRRLRGKIEIISRGGQSEVIK